MYKNLATITIALAILSGAFVTDRAQAGSSTSASSKYDHSTDVAYPHHIRKGQPTRAADFRITEFSSSSAKGSGPKR
jgi:hypothetical protein